MNNAVRLALGSLLGLAALGTQSAHAAVSAGDANYTFPLNSNDGEVVSITLNVTENMDGNGKPLVAGSPRPLQLIQAASSDQAVMVSHFRNCLTLSFQAPGPSSFMVSYTMTDGTNPGQFNTDGGTLTFLGSSTASYVQPTDTQCGDAGYTTAAQSDTAQTVAGQPVLIPVLDNDAPFQSLAHHVIFAAGARDNDVFTISTPNGSAIAQADKIIKYTPNATFSGTDTFTYLLEDYAQPGFEGLNSMALVSVNVLPNATVPTSNPTTPTTPNPNPSPNPDPSPNPLPTPPTGPNPQPPLPPQPDEEDKVRLTVNGTIVNGTTASDGAATTLADTDLKSGETVKFEVVSSDPKDFADIVKIEWFVGSETQPRQSSLSRQFAAALPDGTTNVKVVGFDTAGFVGSKFVAVTIGAAPQMLSDLGTLPPNQMGVAGALDRMCRSDTDTSNTTMTNDQQDAIARCQAIARSNPADQMRALEELSGMDFNGSRTQTLLFTKSTYSGVSDRLGALRGGASGVSLRGFNLMIDGKAIPLADLQQMVSKIFGGGASADETESLLGDRWGLWTRGNMTLGSKSASDSDRGFKANQFSLVSGLDYRFAESSVVGTAVSFGASNVAYNPIGEGGLDTKTWAVTFYGTTYALKRGYFDASVNVADANYASHRRINYTDFLGSIDRNARGKTTGLTWSASLAGGYDLVLKGITISPNGSVFYTDSGINGFRERGAGGLDLAYDDQSFQSLTATLGLRINYAWRAPFGVLMPYLRTDYVRELESQAAVFNVRFANDLDSTAAPIAVQSDAPDPSYWRMSGGVSAQLPFGFAGYVEYQRLESLEFVDFQDFAFGLRMQYRF